MKTILLHCEGIRKKKCSRQPRECLCHPRGCPQSIEFYEQALAIDREIGDRRGEAIGSWNLGLAYEKSGEIEKAITAIQIRVDFEREIGHPDAEKETCISKRP